MEAVRTNSRPQRRLSLNSFFGIRIVRNVHLPEIKWPTVGNEDGDLRETSLREQRVILANNHWRNAVPIPHNVAVDTVWRPTPVMVWQEIVGELRRWFGLMPHDQSTEEGNVVADACGCNSEGGCSLSRIRRALPILPGG